MFDKELENKYVFNTRMLKGKELLKKWHPDKFEQFSVDLGEYNLAVLGSITSDVIDRTGLDTIEQIVELINKYSTKKIIKEETEEQLKYKGLVMLKRWNPDNYQDLLLELSDGDLIKLAKVDKSIISAYGLNTPLDIKTCIKKGEASKFNNLNVDFYNGNYNEFLYNTFISFRKIHDNQIDSDIDLNNFDFEFFGKLMEDLVKTYIIYHKK